MKVLVTLNLVLASVFASLFMLLSLPCLLLKNEEQNQWEGNSVIITKRVDKIQAKSATIPHS